MPNEDLGQHLLTDADVISRVVNAAKLLPGDTVLDGGAGAGALTRPIAAAVAPGKVYAVDVDPRMVKRLNQKPIRGTTVVEADLLEWPLPELDAVVANPPFKIAAPFIERVAHVPRGVYVLPRELADRLAAKPGTKNYGKLTIRVALQADVDDLGYVPRKAFTPPPGVTCGIIRLRAREPIAADSLMLDAVLDAAWAAWERKARHAFAPLAPLFRADGAALASFLKEHGWAEPKTHSLPPEAFAAVAQHLSAGRNDS
ncbi:MAG: ribosomal RNA small subunit methyltransferase A [Thermoplasmatota archaeon]